MSNYSSIICSYWFFIEYHTIVLLLLINFCFRNTSQVPSNKLVNEKDAYLVQSRKGWFFPEVKKKFHVLQNLPLWNFWFISTPGCVLIKKILLAPFCIKQDAARSKSCLVIVVSDKGLLKVKSLLIICLFAGEVITWNLHPSNRSKQILETQMAYCACTQYALGIECPSLNEKQYTVHGFMTS